jgi:hypothetical protein
VSNIGTLPIHVGGGTCSDPQFGINGDQISAITGPTKTGFLVVQQSTAPVTGVSNAAFALFQQTPGSPHPPEAVWFPSVDASFPKPLPEVLSCYLPA